jgi:hypothetical protein
MLFHVLDVLSNSTRMVVGALSNYNIRCWIYPETWHTIECEFKLDWFFKSTDRLHVHEQNGELLVSTHEHTALTEPLVLPVLALGWSTQP